MRRRFSWLAVVIAIGFATYPSLHAQSQGATDTQAVERVYREKIDSSWDLLNQIKNRQIRQDRVLGFGFGITMALLVGLGLVVLSRRPLTSIAPTGSSSKAEIAAFATPQQRIVASTPVWIQHLARLRLDAHQASVVRRQKRIRNLLLELEAQIADTGDTNRRFREALDNLVKETKRFEADRQTPASDQIATRPPAEVDKAG